MFVIATILGMLLFGIMGTTMVHMTANNLSSATEDLQSSQAFYVAEGGVQYVEMSQFNGDTNFADNNPPTDPPFGANSISLSPGQFWVEYVNKTSSSVTVKVTAKVGTAVRVIEQNVGQSGTGFQYVTMAGGNINANSSTGNIYGDVGLKGNVNISSGVVVHGNIYQDPTIVLPTLDFNVYMNMCTTTNNGNMDINSNYTGNLCVIGDVTIGSNVTYTGLLYSTGKVTVNGNNVHINGSLLAEGNIKADNRSGLQFIADNSNPNQHMPAIAGKSLLELKNDDNMTIKGVMWNDGNLDYTNSDNLDYTGSFMAGQNVIMNSSNNLKITFDSEYLVGVPGLSGGGGAQSGSLSLSGWKTYAPWW